jgi:hypothetical protein
MAGVGALSKVQYGAESTAGTAVAASKIWPGPFAAIEDLAKVEVLEEAYGVYGGVGRTQKVAVGAKLVMPSQPATFETLPIIMAAGIDNAAATAAGPGGSSEYTYTADLSEGTAETPKTFTLESGDNQAVEEMEYCFVEEFSLSGAIDEPVMLTATWRGRQVSASAFTASLVTLAGVETIPFNGAQLYIDAAGAAFGNTAKAGTLIGFDLRFPTGFVPDELASAQLYFSTVKQVDHWPELKLTFDHDGTGAAEKAAWLAGTLRKLRLKFTGSLIGGTTYKTATIDLCGKWTSFEAISTDRGINRLTGTLKVVYSVTDTARGQFVVVNALSAFA